MDSCTEDSESKSSPVFEYCVIGISNLKDDSEYKFVSSGTNTFESQTFSNIQVTISSSIDIDEKNPKIKFEILRKNVDSFVPFLGCELDISCFCHSFTFEKSLDLTHVSTKTEEKPIKLHLRFRIVNLGTILSPEEFFPFYKLFSPLYQFSPILVHFVFPYLSSRFLITKICTVSNHLYRLISQFKFPVNQQFRIRSKFGISFHFLCSGIIQRYFLKSLVVPCLKDKLSSTTHEVTPEKLNYLENLELSGLFNYQYSQVEEENGNSNFQIVPSYASFFIFTKLERLKTFHCCLKEFNLPTFFHLLQRRDLECLSNPHLHLRVLSIDCLSPFQFDFFDVNNKKRTMNIKFWKIHFEWFLSAVLKSLKNLICIIMPHSLIKSIQKNRALIDFVREKRLEYQNNGTYGKYVSPDINIPLFLPKQKTKDFRRPSKNIYLAGNFFLFRATLRRRRVRRNTEDEELEEEEELEPQYVLEPSSIIVSCENLDEHLYPNVTLWIHSPKGCRTKLKKRMFHPDNQFELRNVLTNDFALGGHNAIVSRWKIRKLFKKEEMEVVESQWMDEKRKVVLGKVLFQKKFSYFLPNISLGRFEVSVDKKSGLKKYHYFKYFRLCGLPWRLTFLKREGKDLVSVSLHLSSPEYAAFADVYREYFVDREFREQHVVKREDLEFREKCHLISSSRSENGQYTTSKGRVTKNFKFFVYSKSVEEVRKNDRFHLRLSIKLNKLMDIEEYKEFIARKIEKRRRLENSITKILSTTQTKEEEEEDQEPEKTELEISTIIPKINFESILVESIPPTILHFNRFGNGKVKFTCFGLPFKFKVKRFRVGREDEYFYIFINSDFEEEMDLVLSLSYKVILLNELLEKPPLTLQSTPHTLWRRKSGWGFSGIKKPKLKYESERDYKFLLEMKLHRDCCTRKEYYEMMEKKIMCHCKVGNMDTQIVSFRVENSECPFQKFEFVYLHNIPFSIEFYPSVGVDPYGDDRIARKMMKKGGGKKVEEYKEVNMSSLSICHNIVVGFSFNAEYSVKEVSCEDSFLNHELNVKTEDFPREIDFENVCPYDPMKKDFKFEIKMKILEIKENEKSAFKFVKK